MSLYSLSLSGLNTAQAGLATTSHNIDNAATPGYNRQVVDQTTAGATPTANGFIGRGVLVTTIQRQYSNFLYSQLVNSQSTAAQLNTQYNQLTQVNDMLGDGSTGISPALTDFFSSLNSAASSPADPAVRQDLLGKTGSLVSQINTAYQQLQDQRNGLNDQITTTVAQVNSYLDRINDLNKQIVQAQNSSGGQPPNDLMDQRDQAVLELGELVGVKTYQQGNSINITLSGGQTLLSGTTEYKLSAVTSSTDPESTVVAYSVPTPSGGTVPVQLADDAVTGGSLGGLLAFRSQDLDVVQNQLGQFAMGLAMTLNSQQEQGLDLNGQPGKDIFGMSTPALRNGAGNTGSALVSSTPEKNVTYTVSYDGAGYTVTDSNGNTVPASATPTTVPSPDGGVAYDPASQTLSFDGFTIQVSGTPGGTPATPDTWTVQPYSLQSPGITSSGSNAGAATLSGVDVPSDYKISTSDGTNFTVVRESDGKQVYQGTLDANNNLSFQGVTLNFNGTVNAGDSWELQPDGMSGPPAISDTRNAANDAAAGVPGAVLQSSYLDPNKFQASDYQIATSDGVNYTVVRESDGSTVFNGVPNSQGEIQFDGLSVSISGQAAAGDRWELQPMRDAAGYLTSTFTDPSQLALADAQGGTTNGNNGLVMAKLQTAKVLGGGTMNLNEMYSSLANTVGVQSQQVNSALTAQNNLITQQTSAQQSVSGVNLNEEYVNLTQYQEQYQASAKILDVANTIFDTLLGVAN
ncbi:MAG TPA: flagellar hook-associated protein FlgK [Rhodopila sp.]